MFRPPVLKRSERERLAYYLDLFQTLKECYRIRTEQKTYHKFAREIDLSWRMISGRAPTLIYMWERLTEAICETDSELCANVRKLCKAGELQGLPHEIISELARLLAGEALENGQPR